MSIIEIIMLSIALAMDCFAVSMASSVSYGRYEPWKILRMTLFFGLFQGFMPVVGWLLGVGFVDVITRIDHWLAFGILGYLGCKMIYENIKSKDDEKTPTKSPYSSFKMLLSLSVATSIDALATGIIFVSCGNLIFKASIIIFLGSFIFTIIGCILGLTLGKKLNIKIEIIGGLILIGIGFKILIEHLFYAS